MVDDEINGKLDTLIDQVESNSEILDDIKTLLVGDVKDSEKIGVLERLRKVEKWIEKREWFEKLVIVAIVGNAIGLVFLLIQGVLAK